MLRRLVPCLLLMAIIASPLAAVNCTMAGATAEPSGEGHVHHHAGSTDESGDRPDARDAQAPVDAGCVMVVACGSAGIVAAGAASDSSPLINRSPETRTATNAANTALPTQDPPPPRLPV